MLKKKKWSAAVRKAVGKDESDSADRSSLDNAEPELCIKLLQVPSIQNYTGLKKRISEADKEWMQQFLELDGLGVLFLAAERICDRKMSFTDAFLQLEVVACIKSVMSSKIGIDFVATHEESTRKLARVLDTNNVLVKKQVFELLSGLCVYSHRGYMLAIDALEDYKRAKNLRYRFSLIINELKSAEILPYKTTLLAFVNAILISTEEFEIRVRLRNEFIGLKLLEILEELRRDEERTEDQDLTIQLDCFFEHKSVDDEDLEELFPDDGVDLNSPVDVFHAVFKKIGDSPHAASLLSILHALLQLESTDPLYDKTWELLEKLVIQGISLDQGQDIATLLNEGLKNLINCKKVKDAGGDIRKLRKGGLPSRAVSTQTDKAPEVASGSSAGHVRISSIPPAPGPPPPPPPPPPPFGVPPAPFLGGIPPPPPPPPPPGGIPPPPGGIPPPPPPPPPPGGVPPPPPPPPPPGGVPPPPPPPGGGPPPFPGAPPPPPPPGGVISPTRQATTMSAPAPRPTKKLRKLNWSKIPVNKVMSPHQGDSEDVKNIWRNISEKPMDMTPEFEVLENLFSQKTSTPKKKADTKPKKESKEVTLLDGKRSLNVNIFLKQFRKPNKEIITLLKKGDPAEVGGVEKLKGLEKLLPSRDEIDTLQAYKGEEARLGTAEQFFLLLTRLSNYKLRIDGMVVKEEFKSNMDYLKPAIDTLQECCNGILESKLLQEFLALVLVTGNFMNSGGFAGNAAGFKISSLLKLQDTRANKPRVTLMHYLVEVAEEKDERILSFPDEIKHLPEASKLSVDYLKSEMGGLRKKVEDLEKQLDKAEDDVKEQLTAFLETANHDIEQLQREMAEIDLVSQKLALYFCEDPAQFKLEESLSILKTFAERVKTCQEENKKRKTAEVKAEARRLKKEEQDAAIKASGGKVKRVIPPPSDEGCIIDNLLSDIKKGFPLRKAQVHSDEGAASGRRPIRRKGNKADEGKKRSEEGMPETIAEVVQGDKEGARTVEIDGIQEENKGKPPEEQTEADKGEQKDQTEAGREGQTKETAGGSRGGGNGVEAGLQGVCKSTEMEEGIQESHDEGTEGEAENIQGPQSSVVEKIEIAAEINREPDDGDTNVGKLEAVIDDGRSGMDLGNGNVQEGGDGMDMVDEDAGVGDSPEGLVKEVDRGGRQSEVEPVVSGSDDIWELRSDLVEVGQIEVKGNAVENDGPGGNMEKTRTKPSSGIKIVSIDLVTEEKGKKGMPVNGELDLKTKADGGEVADHANDQTNVVTNGMGNGDMGAGSEQLGLSVDVKERDGRGKQTDLRVGEGKTLAEKLNGDPELDSWDNLSVEAGENEASPAVKGNGETAGVRNEDQPARSRAPPEMAGWDNISEQGVDVDDISPVMDNSPSSPKKKKKFKGMRSFFSGIKKGLSAPKPEEVKVERSSSFDGKDPAKPKKTKPKRSQSLTFTNKSKAKDKMKNSKTFSEGPLSGYEKPRPHSPNSNNNNSRREVRSQNGSSIPAEGRKNVEMQGSQIPEEFRPVQRTSGLTPEIVAKNVPKTSQRNGRMVELEGPLKAVGISAGQRQQISAGNAHTREPAGAVATKFGLHFERDGGVARPPPLISRRASYQQPSSVESTRPTRHDQQDGPSVMDKRRAFTMQRSMSTIEDKFNEQAWRKLRARYSLVGSSGAEEDEEPREPLDPWEEEGEEISSRRSKRGEEEAGDVGRLVVSQYTDPNLKRRQTPPSTYKRRQSLGVSWPK